MGTTATEEDPAGAELSVAGLLRAATDGEGLSDFGDEEFLGPLEALVTALNEEARLNARGRRMQHDRILNSLKNRLRQQEWLRLHPEIRDEELLPPVVIVGLPRTGTTMLQRILASDSRFHTGLSYELNTPAPYMDWKPTGTDKRIVEAERRQTQILVANPKVAAILPMGPLAPNEEIRLLDHSFLSYVPTSYAHIPSYRRFVAESDHVPTYEYLELQLKFLQWQKKRRGEMAERWLLKSPYHLHWMQILLDVFPDAQVIATHRDPSVTIPSVTSLFYNLWLIGDENADKHVVADETADVFARGVLHTMETREGQEDRFFDVWYEDTVATPLDVIEGVYGFIGMDFTAGVRAAMEKHRGENRRSDRPSHEYTLEEYGYTEAGIRSLFEEYCRRFIDRPREIVTAEGPHV